MKILTVIQARIDSTRLPRKIMMPIQGKPILEHIITFLKYSKLTDQIVVATTILSQDDEVEKLSKIMDVDCFRGNSENVLSRYYECAKFFKGDLIVRITADNPIVDPVLIDEVIRLCKETECDYASNVLNKTYPLGYSPCEAFTFATLKKLHKNQKDPRSQEHVTYHIRQNPYLYNIRDVKAPSNLARPNWRLTVDYIEDFELISKIFSRLYIPNSFIKYQTLVEFLDKNKHLLKINEMHH